MRTPRSARRGRASPTAIPARSSSLRTAGTGPIPITRGSTPATALATNAPSGSTPSARAFSSDAITSAAAPSLSPLELPAVTVPPSRNGRLQRRELVGARVRPRVLVADELADRHELVREVRLGPPPLRAKRERVLILARDLPALGHVLARLAHRLEREARRESRIREAPAERRVVHRAIAARKGCVGLRGHERRAAHRLDPARDEEVAVAGRDRVAGADDRGEAGRAEPVDRHACHRLRQPGEQRRHPRDVAVVLAGLVRAAEVDVLDLAPARRRRARPRLRSRSRRGRRAARPRARRRSGRPASAPPRE